MYFKAILLAGNDWPSGDRKNCLWPFLLLFQPSGIVSSSSFQFT